jgi:hypothetical protein
MHDDARKRGASMSDEIYRDAEALRGARLVARLVSRRRRAEIAAELAAGRARRVAAVELLAPENLSGLARLSLALLLAGGAGFGVLEWAAAAAHGMSGLPGIGGVGARVGELIAGNVVLYAAILPVHEAVHAAVILALGGRPRFGLKLPLALYCTAPGQLFTRGGYTAIALAPLVVLSLAGGAATWLDPGLGAYLLLALAGNVSGAAGDLVAARDMRTLPRGALVADTSSGYEAYVIEGAS